MPNNAVTINDIARLANVSKATVSRVINQKPDVDAATRERILRIMDEQGFVPSITAAGLAGGRTRLIGVLVPSLTWPLPIIPEIMRGIGEVVEGSTYELVLYSISHERERSAVIARIMAARLIEGLLAVFPGPALAYLSELHASGFPVVMLDDQLPPTGTTPWVSADSRSGARDAVKHLLQLGHRRIAHIQGPIEHLCSADRYQGYCDALTEAGIVVDPQLVVQGDFTALGSAAGARQLLSLPERPTAIFAGNDDMAAGVLRVAEEMGLRVPDALAVVGFDDAVPAPFMHPPLTTVSQPFFDMGKHAATLLLDAVNAQHQPVPSWRAMPHETAPIREFLPTRLVVRESCGATRRVAAGAASVPAR